MPLYHQTNILILCSVPSRAPIMRGVLWQDSFPEDKPLESLLDILKLASAVATCGIRAAFSKSTLPIVDGVNCPDCVSVSLFRVARSGKRRQAAVGSGWRLRLNNDDNAMKRNCPRICAAVIDCCCSAFMTAAALATPPLINAEPTEPAPSLRN